MHWVADDMINILEFADDPAEKIKSCFPDAIIEVAWGGHIEALKWFKGYDAKQGNGLYGQPNRPLGLWNGICFWRSMYLCGKRRSFGGGEVVAASHEVPLPFGRNCERNSRSPPFRYDDMRFE